MAFCASCGAAVSDGASFCPKCGKAVGVNQAQAAPAAPGATSAGAAAPSAPGLAPNVAGALAYVLGFITGILFFVLEPYRSNRFVRFHAMQSILFSAACIIFSIAWGILWAILYSISTSLLFLGFPIRMLISLAFFVLWLFVMYQAYNNREYQIPIVGPIAAKQAGL